MNLVAFKNGLICFSTNLYYNSRPVEFFPRTYWFTPWGLLLPLGAPAIQMRNFIFDRNATPEEQVVQCHTAVLIEPDGRCCTIEFSIRGGQIEVFRDYRPVENDSQWITADDFTLSQYAATFLSLTEEPKDILPLIPRLQEFIPGGYLQYDYQKLVELVATTIKAQWPDADKPAQAIGPGGGLRRKRGGNTPRRGLPR